MRLGNGKKIQIKGIISLGLCHALFSLFYLFLLPPAGAQGETSRFNSLQPVQICQFQAQARSGNHNHKSLTTEY